MLKTWFITGASSGLGLEMTRQLLTQGQRVIATTRRPEALAQMKQDHHERLDVVELDLVAPDSITAAVDGAFRRHDRIDVVVSNAGYGLFDLPVDLFVREFFRSTE